MEPRGDGRYRVELSRYFSVVGRPNGGYLQCVMANAALAGALEAGSVHQHAAAITTNYVGAPVSGVAEIVVDVRRVGRGATFAHVELFEEGQLMTESLVTLATLSTDDKLRYHDAPTFSLPPRDECVRSNGGPVDEINMGKSVEMLMDPDCTKWWAGEKSDRADVRAWLRLDDTSDSWWDAWSVLFASDAMPPATFAIGSTGWVPTLQLSSYVRSVPTSEWLRVRQWCVVVEGSYADERCEIFDDRDRLVASASQMVMCRFPASD